MSASISERNRALADILFDRGDRFPNPWRIEIDGRERGIWTDGSVAIQFDPAEADLKAPDDIARQLAKYFASARPPTLVVERSAALKWAGPVLTGACVRCDGKPETASCDRCGGDGEVECRCSDCDHRHDVDCPDCDGTGRGCSACDDIGLVGRGALTDEDAGQFCGRPVDRRRLALLLAFLDGDSVRVSVGADGEPLVLRGADRVALLMPLHARFMQSRRVFHGAASTETA